MKDVLKILFVLSIMNIAISCSTGNGEDDKPGNVPWWIYNNETLGDTWVSLELDNNIDCEGRVNDSEWIMFDSGSVIKFPLDLFEDGENELQLRNTNGNIKGDISSKKIWKGEYDCKESGSTSIDTSVYVEEAIAYDVVVEIRNTKGTDDRNDDEIIYMISDDTGKIIVKGMVQYSQVFIRSKNYLLYDVWYEGGFMPPISLRKKVAGTNVSGTFLQYTEAGEIPMDDSYGDVTGIGVQYTDGEKGVSVCYIRYNGGDVDIGAYNQTNGNYSIIDIAPGAYNSYVNLLTPWGWRYYRSSNYTIGSGETYPINHTVERRIGQISGVVMDNGVPAAGYYLRLLKYIDWNGYQNELYSDIFTTGSNGAFSTEALYGDNILMISSNINNLNNTVEAEKLVPFLLYNGTQDIDPINLKK